MRPIEVEALTRRFGEFIAVKSVSFHVEEGEIFGYLGANGAGKSTTIRMLCGLLAPTSGRATVSGVDIASDPEGVKRSIGYVSQKFSLYQDLLVEENLEFFGGAYGLSGKALQSRIDAALAEVELFGERKRRTGDLPGGLRQRVALASALLHQPRILFLDEPTAGVDPLRRRVFWDLIKSLAAKGTTIFVTTHYMDEAENCRRIGLMVDGELVALDTPAHLKRDHVPGTIYSIKGAGVERALPLFSGTTGVFDAHPFGAALHVRTEPSRLSREGVIEKLAGIGLGHLEVGRIDPTLEDVFLAVAESAR
ncbi:MAG: ABC transporter ATP-binding protein [Deltaproteobacteria bacterium]|nr:ABC transporter ATP-binding protein [Deltaproteobacteria bacterium]